jgi:hypothetical protein
MNALRRPLILSIILAALFSLATSCQPAVNNPGGQVEATATVSTGLERNSAPSAALSIQVTTPAGQGRPASATPSPLPAASPTPQPSPTPAVMIAPLTQGGCCVQPFWSPDGQRVMFIDKPSPQEPAGIWAVDLQGGAPEFVTDKMGVYSADRQLFAYPQGGLTYVERVADGQRWTIPNGGRVVTFSPDGEYVAWTGGQSGPPFDTARRQVWVSRYDGSQERNLASVFGGGFASWFPDGRLLISGRMDANEPGDAFWILDPLDGNVRELARGSRLRGGALSPQGSWLLYQVTFSENPDENGLWLVNTNSGERTRLELYGAARWRDEERLLVIPLDLQNEFHSLWQVDLRQGSRAAARRLVDPQEIPFKVANGDWAVSPDGAHIAYVSAQDHNIWLLTLPQ